MPKPADEKEARAMRAIEKLGGHVNAGTDGQIIGVELIGTQAADADLKDLKDFKGLVSRASGNTQITNAGLKELKDLKNLTGLGLFNTKVTGHRVEGAERLKKPPEPQPRLHCGNGCGTEGVEVNSRTSSP